MSYNLKIDKNLGTDFKNIKAGEVSSPINISVDKVQIDGDLEVTGNTLTSFDTVSLNSLTATTLNSTTHNANTIQIKSGASIDGTGGNDQQLDINCSTLFVNSVDNSSVEETCFLQLMSLADNDVGIIFREGVSQIYYMGIDADDSDKLKIGGGATIGTSTVAEISSSTITFKTDFECQSGAGTDIFSIKADGSADVFQVGGEDGNYSVLRLNEQGGSSSTDYFQILVEEHGATTVTTHDNALSSAHLTLDVDGDINLDADSGDIKLKDGGSNVATFDSSNFRFRLYNGDSALNLETTSNRGASTISTVDASGANEGHLSISPSGTISLSPVSGGVYVREMAIPAGNVAAYGQLWVKNTTPNELYFTTDAGDSIQITDGTSLAGGGGGTSRWTYSCTGYKSSNASSTNYYYSNYAGSTLLWSGSDSSPTTTTYIPLPHWIAPADGTLTRIQAEVRVQTTADDGKFYVYKSTPSDGVTTRSLTLIGTSDSMGIDAINQTFTASTAISSSNTFSQNDGLYIMWKKDSHSGTASHYFTIAISGEFS